MFNSLFKVFSNDLAIDLGTANTLVYSKGKGIICNEPSIVAIREDASGGKEVISVGTEAKLMSGKTPTGVRTVKPLRDGVVADFEVTEQMLRSFIQKANGSKSFVKSNVIICIPYGVTDVERRAVKDSAHAAGAKDVLLVYEPVAAAIGAGLPVDKAYGSIVVDIGGGTTEIAVLSLNGLVYSNSLRIGGDKFDESIIQYIRRNYNLVIGDQTAEKIKLAIGSAAPTGENPSYEVKGRDCATGLPQVIEVYEEEIAHALSDPIKAINQSIIAALEETPPELSSDIMERGIILTGGGSLLNNLAEVISKETDLPVKLADNPLTAVVNGAGIILENMDQYASVLSM